MIEKKEIKDLTDDMDNMDKWNDQNLYRVYKMKQIVIRWDWLKRTWFCLFISISSSWFYKINLFN